MAKIITLSDIGKKLNVSTVTVSKALSGKKGVSESLRAEIIEAAEEMGYVRKKDTPEFKRRKSYNIGVLTAERLFKGEAVFLLAALSGYFPNWIKKELFYHVRSSDSPGRKRGRTTGKINYLKKFVLPKEMPTAFFCNCDLTAGLLMERLREVGCRVPEDIFVVGFDNYANDQVAKVGITTYEIDTKEMYRKFLKII